MVFAIAFPDIDPALFTLRLGSFEFALRWYALAYIVGIVIGWRIALAAVRRAALWPRGTAPLTPAEIEELLTWIILGIILGGRLGYVLFYQPGYYLTHPAEILAIWQGGMAFHGGMLGVTIAALLFYRKRGVNLLSRQVLTRERDTLFSLLDLLALAAPPGLLLGRGANFINAELWGRPTDLPWGVIFPGQAAQDCAGIVAGACARHPSQVYEAVLEGLILGGALIWLAFRRQALTRPGRIVGIFLAGYGAARFCVEFVRQADPQFITADNPLGHVIQLGPAGLSMGQLLSLPMILLGLALIQLSRMPGRAP